MTCIAKYNLLKHSLLHLIQSLSTQLWLTHQGMENSKARRKVCVPQRICDSVDFLSVLCGITWGWNFQHCPRVLDTNIPLKHYPKHFQKNSRNAYTDMSLLSHLCLTCHVSPYERLKLVLFQMHLHDGAVFNIGHSESPATRVCIFFYVCQEICVFSSFFFWFATISMQWCFSQRSYHYFRTEQCLAKNGQYLSSEGLFKQLETLAVNLLHSSLYMSPLHHSLWGLSEKSEIVQSLEVFWWKQRWQSRGKARKKDSRDERYKRNESASELLMIFLNGMIFKYGKWHFSLEGFDFSHCLSAQCDQKDDQSFSSRLWLLGLYPKAYLLLP